MRISTISWSMLSLALLAPIHGIAQEPTDTLESDTLRLEAPPPERLAQDTTATGELQALFSRIEELRQVDVTVDGGVARLTGRTQSLQASATARDLASLRDDVVYVDDRIEVDTSLARRTEAMLGDLRARAVEWLVQAPLLLGAILIMAAFWSLGRILSSLRWLQERLGRTPFTADLAGRAIRIGFGLTGLVLALDFLDATKLVGALLGAAGVAGLAFGFAFRNIAENWLVSILLSIRRPFDLDDTVLIDGSEGRVVRLTHSDTVLMTLAGNHLRIPNAAVYNGRVENFTRNPLRMMQLRLTVPRDTDVDQARAVLLGSLTGSPALGDPEPSVLLVEVGDSHLALALHAWVDQRSANFNRARSIVYKGAKDALAGAGIQGPISEHTLHMSDAGAPDQPGHDAATRPAVAIPAPSPEVAAPADELESQLAEERERSGEDNLLPQAEPGT